MKAIQFVCLALLALLWAPPLHAQAPDYGYAVYYADYFHGKPTASGEKYDKYEMTAAHKTYPFGTLLKVTRMDNYKEVTVRVNDRGPYSEGCIIDLSWAAADKLELLLDGKAEVKVEVVGSTGQVAAAPKPKQYEGADPVATILGDMAKANSAFDQQVTAEKPAKPEPKASYAAFPAEDRPVSYSAGADITRKAPVDQLWLGPDAQGYGVQVGSYGSRENALRQANLLKQKGLTDVHLKEKYDSSKGTLYKIIVGQYASQEDAAEQKAILQGRHQLKGFVVNLAF